ncbi:hypothetical protein VNI00_005491 [Paramarasmius palmivorus]|uniref:Uncharacterized protein n=1 Tax=Paramarasmius palmivorus TaxID=297713 RepID=A0AAW0DHU4_9AGAR
MTIHFASTYSALEKLKRARPPPKYPNPSDPNLECLAILPIFDYFTSRNTTPWKDESTYFENVIFKNWSGYIGIWFTYLLEKFVLPRAKPNTQQGLIFRDQIISILPKLLLLGHDSRRESRANNLLRGPGRSHIPLIAKVWSKLVETSHPMAWNWTMFIRDAILTHSSSLDLILEFETNVSDVVGILLRKMQRCALSCRSSAVNPSKLLPGFNTSLTAIVDILHPFGILHSDFISRGGVGTLVKVVSGILSWPELVHYTDPEPLALCGLGTISVCMNLLETCIVHPFDAYQALQAGLLKGVVIIAARYHHEDLGLPDASREDPDCNLGNMVAQVLRRISRLLVYPFVLRRFKRAEKKYVTEEWRESVARTYKRLSEAWELCLYNSGVLIGIQAVLRSSLCAYDKASSNWFPITLLTDALYSVQIKEIDPLGIFAARHAPILSTARKIVPGTIGHSTKFAAQN